MEPTDVKSVVKQLKDEFWEWQLSKPDPIPKPKVYRLPLIANRASYNDVKKKYPPHHGWKTIHHLRQFRAKWTDPRPWWSDVLTILIKSRAKGK